MLCDDFDARMDQLLDMRRHPEWDAALVDHARACDRCQRALNAQAALFRGLQQCSIPEPSARFTQTVLGSLTTPGDVRKSSRLHWAVGIVASLVLVVAAARFIQRQSEATQDGNPATADRAAQPSDTHTESVAVSEPESSPSLAAAQKTPTPPNGSRSGVQPASPSLAAGLPGLTGGLGALTIGFDNLPQRKQVDELAGGLRPIADGFEAAIDALKSTVGTSKDSKPGKPHADLYRRIWSKSLA